MPVLIRDATLLDPEHSEPQRGCLIVEGERIVDRLPEGAAAPADLPEHPLSRRRVAPGLIDLHYHGELVYARAGQLAGALERTSRALARDGVTAFLATTVAWAAERVNEFMTQAQAFMTQPCGDGAALLGVHLEGPWINPEAAGAQPHAPIRPYTSRADRELLERHHEILRMVTLAPECAGSDALIDALTRHHVIASLGHSVAPGDLIDAATERGMTHVTHLFNAMGGVHHREPGVAGWVLGEPRLTCDLICDGVHVHPRMLALAARALGDRMVAITDRIAPPPAGETSFGSGAVLDDGHALRLPDGRLAGSTLTLDRAVRNARALAGLSEVSAIAAATLRPARVLGIESERGTLRVGARADLVAFDESGRVEETWLGGRRIHPAPID